MSSGPRACLLPLRSRLRWAPLGLCLVLAALPGHAERGDAQKPLNISSDGGGKLDVVNQRTEFDGNVMMSRGSLLLKAAHMDLRETPDGYFLAHATSGTGQMVSFHQGRDVPGEAIEGQAEQLEYDSRADTVRFIGNAVVRRMRGTVVTDEVAGALIVYDNRTEVFSVDGGPVASPQNGRVRVVLMPRAASSPQPAASNATLPLQPSPTLQSRKPS
ncbi:MAG: lipopolysaccharide transport periplasmic protein LptA [Burkholderiaceae bacterium]|nr:lipopolysaccharide transport periplasmic protein LptA [Roseateles sp.]MBV8468958.1 lipopolysaccharide transport periplasmic protein LptA [Burkholderiaceae bacterium]